LIEEGSDKMPWQMVRKTVDLPEATNGCDLIATDESEFQMDLEVEEYPNLADMLCLTIPRPPAVIFIV